MEYHDIDKILKATLSPSECPSEELNQKILNQIKESGKIKMKSKKILMAASIALCVLLLPTSIYAAYKYLSPKEAAVEVGDNLLSEAFEKDGKEVIQTVTDGEYKVTYLGHVSGKSISERVASSWELHPERTYVAVAIEKADGTDMSENFEESLFVTPLIQGLKPWQYNIASMNGGYVADVIDGVHYRIIECDNVEVFADRNLYLAVSDTIFYSTEAFNYDETTGLITVNEDYKGTNVLFPMELDPAKADSKKAQEYLEQLEKEWNPTEEIDNREENTAENEGISADDVDVSTDDGGDIVIRMKGDN
ncbi:hypothetical protein GCM10023142_21650 [Anaerocolumna aminovalerica]|jgi:hypothetical protein|uniref:DUF4179 domain-containing protein n=1 Tax=Anaerocolumna aminovalerica TaxID=1527 RepID=A0A1I5DA89_9FIRM|nr:DUF4179 domain-containing protein [Anaerocolumna aminovalerica]MDU6263115.1 DUF4179 domain-containing protein [Anaerocolumna aminovalerica]SFN96145.1 hypothetical protein SAMN04489757_10592 [Anaerocolumna aminovalerica]